MLQGKQTVLQRFRVTDLLASEGQADVWAGRDTHGGTAVVVKHLNAIPGSAGYPVAVARFQREARLQINHPAVVNPLATGEERGQWFIVFPRVDGVQLDQYLEQHGGCLDWYSAGPLFLQLADALAAIHAHGIVHRDLKPANVLIDARGRLYVIDFGICRRVTERTLTQNGALLGTPNYMAPEQVAHPASVGYAADVYALGVLFYEILTGTVPCPTAGPGQLVQPAGLPLPLSCHDPQIPTAVDEICDRCLAPAPAVRFPTARELHGALATIVDPNGAADELCPACGELLDCAATFCSGCGCELYNPVAPAWLCLACGAPVSDACVCTDCARAFTPADHRLVFHEGAMRGLQFRVPEGTYDVGRNELLARDQRLSRRHLHVQCANGACFVQDAGSSNGTCVAGRLANSLIQLAPGDELELAGNRARYSCSF